MFVKILTAVAVLTVALEILPRSEGATPLSSAITYQGQLKQNLSPVNGSADVQFSLFSANSGGSPIGGVTLSQTRMINDGLFTAELDFGAGAYNGNERWLQLSVRFPAGAGSFQTLAPRQRLNATPYAQYALSAMISGTQGGAVNFTNAGNNFAGNGAGLTSLNASNLSTGTLGSNLLSGAYGNALAHSNAGNSFTGSFSGSGAGLSGLNAGSISQGLVLPAFGGTGLNTSAASAGSLLYASGAGTWSVLSPGSNTQVLTLSGGAPTWAAVPGGGLSLPYAGTANAGLGSAAFKVTDTGSGYGLWGQNSASSGVGILGEATAAGGAGVGVYGTSAGTYGVYGSATAASGFTFGGSFQNSSTDGSGVYGSANAPTGATKGGRFENSSTSGIGAYGLASAGSGTTYGGWFSSNSTTGTGVFGTGAGYGGHFISNSNGGTGVFVETNTVTGSAIGGYFLNAAPGGYGIFSRSTDSSGGAIGGTFWSDGISGIGVDAYAAAQSGPTYGVFSRCNSTAGRAVYGFAPAATGDARGVYGISDSTSGLGTVGYARAGSGTTYGIYGQADSASGWGVWSVGRLGASGTKSFRIDHPDDPTNKYLMHYSVESPEVLNAYSGKVTLDGAGQAVVDLPHYFAKINKDPRYTLTAIGAAMPNLHIADEIDESALSIGAGAGPSQAVPPCWFRIAGGAPGAKVSWRVEAVRNDRWVQEHGAPVEIEKQGLERGTYQHPELYGMPREMGLKYEAAPETHEPVSPYPVAANGSSQ